MNQEEFKDILDFYGCKESNECNKYCEEGKTYLVNGESYSGTFWYYVGEDFVIDVQDLYFNEDYITPLYEERFENFECGFIRSNYLLSANGESFEPYGSISSDTMMIIISNEKSKRTQRLSFHKNSKFVSVGIRYFKKYLENLIFSDLNIKGLDIEKIFLDTKSIVTRPISKIANDIINCKMKGISAKMFFDAKAREWFSITLDAYTELKKRTYNIHELDVESIKNVRKYIDDHYALDISQSFLEKVAMMSGTKLKTTFKRYFNQTITEYTQRKRMNIAENLILSTDLDMASIAKAVGYNSPSRFSTLFKRYKGIYPKDVRVKDLSDCENKNNCGELNCRENANLE